MGGDARGQLVVSLDLELELQRESLARQRALDTLTRQLVSLLDQHGLPATFAVADPALSAATETITASRGGHELAVLGDSTWAGPGAGRERFARELTRRFGAARAAGLNISTLALRHLEMAEHFDLLPKQAITVLRTDPVSPRRAQCVPPQVIRFGVWQAAATLRLPQPRGWWFGSEAGPAFKLLKRAAQRGEIVHLLIDVAQLIERETPSLAMLERVLGAAARQRDQEQLEVLTLQNMASQLARPRDAGNQQSILRAA